MNQNPFNLKTFLPLNIQMLADGGERNPPGDGGNGQGATLTLSS